MGELEVRRTYEFLLITWSADADRQLELALGAGDSGADSQDEDAAQ